MPQTHVFHAYPLRGLGAIPPGSDIAVLLLRISGVPPGSGLERSCSWPRERNPRWPIGLNSSTLFISVQHRRNGRGATDVVGVSAGEYGRQRRRPRSSERYRAM